MNRRQAKKQIKKLYKVSVPRGDNPRRFRKFIVELINISSQAISDYMDKIIWRGGAV